VAFTGLLRGHFRQGKRRASLFLQDLLKMPCCPSLTVKLQNQVAAAIQAPYHGNAMGGVVSGKKELAGKY
jgi:hypothetical protein